MLVRASPTPRPAGRRRAPGRRRPPRGSEGCRPSLDPPRWRAQLGWRARAVQRRARGHVCPACSCCACTVASSRHSGPVTPPGIEPGPLSRRVRAAGTMPQRVRAPSLTSGPGIGSLTACMQREPARAVEWEAQRGGEAARLHAGASGASVGRLEDAIFHPARPARPKYSSSSRMSRPRPRAAQSGELAVSARCAPVREVGAARVFGVV